MPLLEDGRLVADDWVTVADDASLPDAPAILSLARLRAEDLAGRNEKLGLALDPATQPEDIADLLPRLSLVAVLLPKSKDGRAFTQARSLREHFGFQGEIRATGDVLVDQLVQMQRSGFTSAVLRADQDMAVAQKQLDRYKAFYQGDAVTVQPIFAREAA